MRYLLLLMVTGLLFIRPGEFDPGLMDVPIYEITILACLGFAFPVVLNQLTFSALAERPITACVVGIAAAIALSQLARMDVEQAHFQTVEFVKVVLYYLLLVGVVDSTDRLRRFLAALVVFVTVLAGLALLQWHRLVDLPALAPLQTWDGTDEATGTDIFLLRLRGGPTGVFGDPNDFCLILIPGLMICLYGLGDGRLRWLRAAYLIPTGILGNAFALTRSRGGFIGLMVALLVLLSARFGKKKMILSAALALPVLLTFLGGRQTDLSTDDGTSQQRIQTWFEGLNLFLRSPVFGIGQDRFAEEVGRAAHNSLLDCYTELGFLGGTLFLGAFYLPLSVLGRLGTARGAIRDPELSRLRPYLMAAIAGYAAGMMPLSRSYVIPTYLVLGLATAFLRLAAVDPPVPGMRLDERSALRLVAVSIASLVAMYVFVQLSVRWG